MDIKKIEEIYKGKRILITGHTGFVGSWLSLWLKKLGAEITGYALPPPTQPNHYNLLNFEIKSIEGDILDFDLLKEAIFTHKPEIIFHLAAQPLVRRSYLEPAHTFTVNVQGTVNLLEAVRIGRDFVKAVVVITSDKCYQNVGEIWGYREKDPLGGDDPYSASKACAEIVANSYRKSFDLLIATARAGNIIGGGDWGKDRLIPDIVRAVSQGKKVKIRNPQAVRPWQYVLDVIYGYLWLGARLLNGENFFADAWNFGPIEHRAYKVIEVVEKIKALWPKVDYELEEKANSFKEAPYLSLDPTKALNFLNWQPIYNLEEALRETIEWYKAFYEEKKVISKKQLEGFLWKMNLKV